MRVLLDTNVLLDIYLERKQFADSLAVLQAHKEGRIQGYVSASTLTDIYYIARRQKGKTIARKAIQLCLEIFAVCTVDNKALTLAYALAGQDFEDDLQIILAQTYSLNAIITRDKGDFAHSAVPAFTPGELLKQIEKDK